MHEHVKVAVESGESRGVEHVPAHNLGANTWRLTRTPTYALGLAANDTIRITNEESGAFEIVSHGGNVAVQFYLPDSEADDAEATTSVSRHITPEVEALGGCKDGQTAGLIVYTIPVQAGFAAIERVFNIATSKFVGSQWQFCNVFDEKTGEPLRWWE